MDLEYFFRIPIKSKYSSNKHIVFILGGIIFSYLNTFIDLDYLSFILMILGVVIVTLKFDYKNVLALIVGISIGFVNSNIIINSKFNNIMTVTKKYPYSYEAVINNKNVIVNTYKDLKVGVKYEFLGEVHKEIDASKGNFAVVNLKDARPLKKTGYYYINVVREFTENKYKEALGEASGKVIALVTGESKALNGNTKDKLREIGIYHIISISGFHFMLIYSMLKKKFSKASIFFIMSFYLILSGCSASATRAYIMIVCLMVSRVIYRNYNSINALVLSALIILTLKPLELFSLGFLLSYAGVIGIFLFKDFFGKLLTFLPEKINDPVAISLSAILLTTPFIFTYIGNTSLITIISGLILSPIYSLLTMLSFLSFVVLLVEPLFSMLCNVILLIIELLDYIENMIFYNFNINLKGSYIEAIVIIFVLIAVILHKKKVKIRNFLFSLLVLYCVFRVVEPVREGFIKYKNDYGFIESRENVTTLYYGGDIKSKEEEEYIKEILNVDQVKKAKIKNSDIIEVSEYYEAVPKYINAKE